MDPLVTPGFEVTVNRPRSYVGKAGLLTTSDTVTLIARPVRHFRAIVASFAVAVIAVIVIGGVFSTAGQSALMDPGLTAPERSAADMLAYGVPIAGGLLCGFLVFGMSLLVKAFRGDSHSMSVSITGVSLAKRKGRLLVVDAAFDPGVRPSVWTLFARNPEEAESIVSALADGGGSVPASTA